MQFGHDVVVIGVEPLGHFHRRGGIGAAGHGKILLQRVIDTGKARRDRPQHRRGVEHVVVQGKIIGGDDVDAGSALVLPVAGAQFGGLGQQRGRGGVALPVQFEGRLEFAANADAGITEIGGLGHGNFSM